MQLEVLLSVMNLDKKKLDNMNITSKCTVINQCDKTNIEEYKNFTIYSYNEIGVSNSRNRALEKAKGDIVLFCDDDVVYNKDYEKKIIEEFENNSNADVIMFNMYSPNRKQRWIKKRKRLHIYNVLNYATYNIACRRDRIENLKFNTNFGPNAKYNNGSDTMFIIDVLKNKLKIYSSSINLGTVYHHESTWFKGYDEKFFFNKGALFTAINPRIKNFLILQYLLRHKEVLTNINFIKAWKQMKVGSKDFLCSKK